MGELGRVWYVAYGSNLASRRFHCYLRGGRPAGATRPYVGCRDPSDPAADEGLVLRGGLVFGGRSPTWGGGTALLDAGADGQVACRAYLLTVLQLADVVAQETRRPPGGAFAAAVADAVAGDGTTHVLGSERYETLLRLGSRAGAPLLTVTSADVSTVELVAPNPAYLRWIVDGLRETHGWSAQRIAAYLASAPGARGAWSPEEVAALATGAPTAAERRD